MLIKTAQGFDKVDIEYETGLFSGLQKNNGC